MRRWLGAEDAGRASEGKKSSPIACCINCKPLAHVLQHTAQHCPPPTAHRPRAPTCDPHFSRGGHRLPRLVQHLAPVFIRLQARQRQPQLHVLGAALDGAGEQHPRVILLTNFHYCLPQAHRLGDALQGPVEGSRQAGRQAGSEGRKQGRARRGMSACAALRPC